MKVFGEDFKQDVALDRFKLDEESEALSAIYDFWSAQQASAKTTAERAKVTLEQIKAKKELEFRRNPPLDIKLTENSILAMISEASEVRVAQEALLIANEKLYNLDAAVYSLMQKKTGLDNLVMLWQRNYYGGKGSYAEESDRVSDAMHEKHNQGRNV